MRVCGKGNWNPEKENALLLEKQKGAKGIKK